MQESSHPLVYFWFLISTSKPFGVRFDREELPYFKQRRLEEIGTPAQFLEHWEVGPWWIDLDRDITRGMEPFKF